MPITRLITYTRPSEFIPLFKIPESVLLHFQVVYGLTSKRVFLEDKLTITVTDVFASQEEVDKFYADPIVIQLIISQDTYNNAQGITKGMTLTETP